MSNHVMEFSNDEIRSLFQVIGLEAGNTVLNKKNQDSLLHHAKKSEKTIDRNRCDIVTYDQELKSMDANMANVTGDEVLSMKKRNIISWAKMKWRK